MKIRNLTPYPLKIQAREGLITIPPAPFISKLDLKTYEGEPITYEGYTIDTVLESHPEIAGLPEPKDDTIYVVSSYVHRVAKAQGRTDVFTPISWYKALKQ